MGDQNPQCESAGISRQVVKGIIQEGGVLVAKGTVKSTFSKIIDASGKTTRILAAGADPDTA